MEFSPWHLLIIAVVVVLLFGTKKIPDFMKGLGEGVRSFKAVSYTHLSVMSSVPTGTSTPSIARMARAMRCASGTPRRRQLSGDRPADHRRA